MALVVRSIEDVLKSYKDWVCKNPKRTSDIESFVKWISYFLAGKVSDSHVLSEMVYCVSNLWKLVNDQILMSEKLAQHPDSSNSVKTWLTVLEYSEVFVEMSARQLYGEKGRWILIAVIQAFKCALRLLLVVQFKEDVLPSPPLEPLKRQELADEVKNSCQPSANTFSLRSGRTIRTITGAPDLHMRSWKPPEPTARIMCNGVDKTTLNESQKLGEALYIVKPLLHLGAMYVHGTKSWAPWIYSLLLDVSSLALLEPKREQFMQQRPETQQMQVISRRKMNLLLYLLRSPFYDEFTRARIERALLAVADTIPLAKIVAMPLVRYLPHWQETYYYLWST